MLFINIQERINSPKSNKSIKRTPMQHSTAKAFYLLISLLLSFTVLLSLSSCDNKNGSGDTDGTIGTTGGETTKNNGKNDPVPPGAIEISTPEQLAKIGKDKNYPLDGDYVLTANIDLSSYNNWTPIGGAENESGVVSGKVFSGTFDGRGHIISGLNINTKSTRNSHYGLFGSLGSRKKNDPCVIKNLILTNVNINVTAGAYACVGALAGQAGGYVEIDNMNLMAG